MRKPALVAVGPTHRRRTDALHARSIIRQSLFDIKAVHIQINALLVVDKEGCVVGKIPDFIATLKDKSAPKDKRREALCSRPNACTVSRPSRVSPA